MTRALTSVPQKLPFALLVSILTGFVFGVAPTLRSARVALYAAIREGSLRSGPSTKTGRLRDVLVVSELAFAVIRIILMAVVLLASYIPARRAARANPLVALCES